MDICSNKHDEVCYTGKSCPVCRVIEEKDELVKELTLYAVKIDSLNGQVNDLIDEIQSRN